MNISRGREPSLSVRASYKSTQGRCHSISRMMASWCTALAVVILVLGAAVCHAQLSTADIVGTVTDATGAVIPGANVVLTDLGTKEQRASTTSTGGDFNFSLLPVGTYSITVSKPGFKNASLANLAVEAGDRARADVQLQAGSVAETVTVEAQTPLLQADNATVSSTVTAKAVQDLPLNGRNFVQLVQLVPGANEGPGNGLTSGGRPDDRRQTSGFSVNGQDNVLNDFTVDGIDDNERIIGTIGVRPDVEGIQEITVETNSYAPEAGRTAGGVVSIITRSGTDQFHGTAYEFFRNDIFDARNVLQTTGAKPELRQNQFGGSIGGPIFKDKTFFFGDYEGFRLVTGQTDTSTIPDISEYDAINSIGGLTPETLVAAGNGTAPYAIDPIALTYLKLFPAPTNANLTNNYVISPNETQFSNTFDVRIDHKFNTNNLIFGRYDYNKVNTFTPPALGVVNGLQISGGQYNFDGPATDYASQLGLGYTHIFTPRLILDLRAAYTRINNLSLPLNYGKNADTTVGFGSNMNFNTTSSELTPIGFGPFADIGDGAYVPLQDIDSTFQYSGSVSYTRGNHSIRAGASLIRRQARNLQSAFPAGSYSFGLTTDQCVPGTGYNTTANACNQSASVQQRDDNDLASSLVGAFSSDSRNYDLDVPDYRSWEPSGFAQDSWKITPKLTVLYGLRYDVFTPFTEAHNHIANFDYFEARNDTTANISSALKVAGVNGVDGHAGIKTDYSNVAPRIGFAYSVTPTIVVRGGYGLSFFPGNYTSNADLKNAPFVSVFSPNCISSLGYNIVTTQGESVQNLGSTVNCASVSGAPTTFDAGLPLPAPQSITSPSLSFVAEDPKFRSALMQQFNLQVEQQFGANVFTIGYVGNIGQHLEQTINDINVPLPYNSGLTTASRPLSTVLPNLSGVNWLQSEGISNYNALQMSLQRRFSHGLAFDGNYTWSKAMSNNVGFSEEGDQGAFEADPFNTHIDYGVAENDIQNRFALSVNYEFQYGKSWHGVEKEALTGWEVNSIVVWQSGKPFTVLNGGGGAANGIANRATPSYNGNDRPEQVADSRGPKKYSEWFNTSAFVPQPLGTIGNEVRNSLFGPRFRHVDLSLFKTFPLTERVNMQFRAEAFDLSNTPNLYIPNNNPGNLQLGSANFGQVVNYDPNYVPRQIQFALKMQF